MTPRRSRLIARFARDDRGASAVEFALLAPTMVLIYFFLLTFCQGFMAERRASHTASIVADLVAQSETVAFRDFDDVFAVGGIVMRPFPETPLGIVISSVTVDDKNVAKVDWSVGKRKTARGKNEVISNLPPGLIGKNQSLIMAETEYVFDLPYDGIMTRDPTFRRTYYLRPRTVEKVACTGC